MSNRLQTIFTDYYEHVLYKLHPFFLHNRSLLNCLFHSVSGRDLKWNPHIHTLISESGAGFYVRAKPNLCTPDITIKYISRYWGRPTIATSRIDNYDGDYVTFHYKRHEDN